MFGYALGGVREVCVDGEAPTSFVHLEVLAVCWSLAPVVGAVFWVFVWFCGCVEIGVVTVWWSVAVLLCCC